MPSIKEIIAICKAGNTPEAYEIARTDLETAPQDVWKQRALGWVLNYYMKEDIANKKRDDFFLHLEELMKLDQLSVSADNMIYDNVMWRIAEFVKYTPKDDFTNMTQVFELIRQRNYTPSKGYSYLLKNVSDFEAWPQLADFFDWWNLDNLLPEDYMPFEGENGKKIMPFAEQMYLAYSKALLKLADKERIQSFYPKIEKLAEEHPEMLYLGYYCCKLLLATGADPDESLDIVMPFVRKKKNEFWVWQLLSDIHKDQPDIRLACLLRAVHCRTQESFLVNIRKLLITLFLRRNDLPRAKYQLDQVVRCYMQNGWRIPYNMQDYIRQPWVQTTVADPSDGVDYRSLTDGILTRGANESIGVVAYIDHEHKRFTVVYGHEQRISLRFSDAHLRIHQGMLLLLYWTPSPDSSISVLNITQADESLIQGLTYIKKITGKVIRRDNSPFAFLRSDGIDCYISPDEVRQTNLSNGDKVAILAVFNYNRKTDKWTWSCAKIKKI